MDTSNIAQRIEKIRTTLPQTVRLIAVSKGVGTEKIREAYQAGIRDFGENRLQDAIPKIQDLWDLNDISWHFIGHLQSNKTKKVLEYFQWIHSVDDLDLGHHLNDLASELNKTPSIFLQVKILPDDHKYGFSPKELLSILPTVNQWENLNIQGLMTILPIGLSPQEILAAFQETGQLAQNINQQQWQNISLQHLSMGMSGDYLLAVKAGATMVRLGTIIFGQRI